MNPSSSEKEPESAPNHRRTSRVSFADEGVDPLATSIPPEHSVPPPVHIPTGSRRSSEPNVHYKNWSPPRWGRSLWGTDSDRNSPRSSTSGHAPSSIGSDPRSSISDDGKYGSTVRNTSNSHSVESGHRGLAPLSEEPEDETSEIEMATTGSNPPEVRFLQLLWMDVTKCL